MMATGLVVLATTGHAVTSGNGHEYTVTCNQSGYVLTSKYPVARFYGQGAATQIKSGIEKLYLGKSCDAFLEGLGEGTWGWANGGFGADFANGSIRFPRQELYCPDDTPSPTDLECAW